LTGIVTSRYEKNKVLETVYNIAGNRRVIDNLSVGN